MANTNLQTPSLMAGSPTSVATALNKPTAKKIVAKKRPVAPAGKLIGAAVATPIPALKKSAPKAAAKKAAAPDAASPGTSKPAIKTVAPTTRQAKPVKSARSLKAVNVTPSAAKPAPAASKGVAAASSAFKTEKPKRAKLVRDSFTIPKAEYLVLDELKLRAKKLMNPAKKSELLRAGIKALSAMADPALLAALKQVPAIKTGRPTGKATKA